MADIFDVIADGTRRDILRLLLDRTSAYTSGSSVSQIVGELGISQPTVSKHLRVLRDAGLVAVREEGQHRFYSLSTGPLDEIDAWLVPFLEADEAALADAVSGALPDEALHAADVVGRAAASAKHALDSVLRNLPGRP
jgi:DNA-binding transcriptional ArsR family regulator